jgi:hypothetical protein
MTWSSSHHGLTPARTPERIQWVRDYYQALTPYSEPGGYINFMQDDDYDKIQDNYRQNYDRLVKSSVPTIWATSSTSTRTSHPKG